jgi:acyl carrier protein
LGTFDATFPASTDPTSAPLERRPWREYVHHPHVDGGELVQVWRQHLRDALPPYMIPSAFVVLDALPLTPNGKIDRKALPEPDRRRAETSASYVRPESVVEETIAEVWQELLNLERVSAHDNFFDLGANSLLMVQAHTALKDKLQRSLSLVDLFRFPSVKSLADHLGNRSGEAAALTESQTRAKARIEALDRRRQGRQAARATLKS